jgi:polyribonucleotide nucleotidyltransferase
MATVCAGSLAMMDAGIPVKKHIAGVALGLITINELPYILTDIIGAEDRYGEMDFKVAGSQDGITAIQLDVKNKGLTFELLKKAFEQSKSARLYILELMHKCIKQPRPKISPYAPQIRKMPIPLDKIGLLIGPGGKTIRQIQELTGSKLEIADDTGELYISANNEKELDAAMEAVSEIIGDLKEGKIYKVRVKAIKDFGAVVETLSGVEGLVHISEITKGYVRRIEDYLKVGQIVNAMMIEKDELGRYRFSIKRISNL